MRPAPSKRRATRPIQRTKCPSQPMPPSVRRDVFERVCAASPMATRLDSGGARDGEPPGAGRGR
eukprot:11186089-Lingulodinium_polyedra.AAC.1